MIFEILCTVFDWYAYLDLISTLLLVVGLRWLCYLTSSNQEYTVHDLGLYTFDRDYLDYCCCVTHSRSQWPRLG